jgi:hypothetical protein
VKVLREIRDLQQKTLDATRQQNLLLLPIFTLLVIGLVLGLTGFFAS